MDEALKLRKEFGTKLKQAIIEKGFENQSAAARELGVALGTLRGWISGQTYPKPERMKQLEDYFETTFSTLGEFEKKQLDLEYMFKNYEFTIDGEKLTKGQKENLVKMAKVLMGIE